MIKLEKICIIFRDRFSTKKQIIEGRSEYTAAGGKGCIPGR